MATKEVKHFRPSWKNYITHYLLIMIIIGLSVYLYLEIPTKNELWKQILLGVSSVCVLLILVKIMLIRFSELFHIDEKELIMERGILSRQSVEVGITQIRTMQVNQSFWQRLMNIGDLLIASAGTEGYEITAHGIDDPHVVRNKIQEIQGFLSDKKAEDKNAPVIDPSED